MSVKVIVGTTSGKPVRFSYVNLFQARLNKESGEMEYGVTLLIPKTNAEDIAAVKAAIKSELDRVFVSKGKKVPPTAWNPFRDGDKDVKPKTGEGYGPEAKGHYLIAVKVKEKDGAPGVVDAKVQKILDPKEVSSGDWGACSFNVTGYDKGIGGASGWVINVQKLRNGEPLSNGGARAEDDFTAVETEDFLN